MFMLNKISESESVIFLYIPMMSRLLYAKPNEHFICLCTYSI